MLKIREISAELAITAKEELNEVTERISSDVDALRQWISKQPHLNPNIDDQLLVTFLRGCKYSLERTKQKIDTYFTIKTTMPELSNRDPTDPVLLEIIRLGLFVVLPTSNKPGGPRVLIIRMFVYKPGQFKISSLQTVFTMVTEILTRDDDNYAISGLQIFCDLTNVGWAHFLELEPSHIKKFFTMLQDALPGRFKGIHYYRPPTGFETFVNLVRTFLNEKNKERVCGFDFFFGKVLIKYIFPADLSWRKYAKYLQHFPENNTTS